MRYKNLLTTVCLVVALSAMAPVFGQNFVEDQINFTGDGKISHTINLSAGGNLYGKLGWYFWSCNNKEWSEAYPGLTFQPFPWAQIGAGYGVEIRHGEVFGSLLWLGKGPFGIIGFWEKGARYWHRVVGNIALNETFGVGFLNETFPDGRKTGLRLEATYKKFRLWSAYMNQDFIITGVNLLF